MQYDLTILTEDRYFDLEKTDPTIEIVKSEDLTLMKEAEALGLKVTRRTWSDRDFDWTKTNFAVFRTTWDYFTRFDEFIRWMGKASRQTHLLNPFKLAQWNLDKHYLLDLQRKGIPIVPTSFIRPLTKTTLRAELEKKGWEKNAVLKPAISGSARHTYHLLEKNLENHESIFGRLIKEESMMLQPFIQNIVDKGELSLIVIDGKYTHAIMKHAKFGDFRVQHEFGGSIEVVDPSDEAIELAEKAIAACPYPPVYGRVDMVWDAEDQLVISELELIEPELFFRCNEDSAKKLAQAIKRYISASS